VVRVNNLRGLSEKWDFLDDLIAVVSVLPHDVKFPRTQTFPAYSKSQREWQSCRCRAERLRAFRGKTEPVGFDGVDFLGVAE
jgi:hypothetical protein